MGLSRLFGRGGSSGHKRRIFGVRWGKKQRKRFKKYNKYAAIAGAAAAGVYFGAPYAYKAAGYLFKSGAGSSLGNTSPITASSSESAGYEGVPYTPIAGQDSSFGKSLADAFGTVVNQGVGTLFGQTPDAGSGGPGGDYYDGTPTFTGGSEDGVAPPEYGGDSAGAPPIPPVVLFGGLALLAVVLLKK